MRKEVQKSVEDYISFFGIEKAKKALENYKRNPHKYNKKGYVFFDENHMTKVIELFTDIDVNEIDNSYYVYNIPKRKGGYREISCPKFQVKRFQEFINENILVYFQVSDYCHGFVKDRSIVTNALNHCNKELVICMDIRNFFPSIKIKEIVNVFLDMGYSKEISIILGKWCSYNERLAIGSPSSPALSNLVFSKHDEIINDIAKRYKFNYSRYADDMAFSTNAKESDYKEFIKEIEKCINDFGFVINEKKTKIYPRGGKQEVTGLIVNNTVKVKSKIKKDVLKNIYYCKKFGLENHLDKYKNGYFNCRVKFLGKVYISTQKKEQFIKHIKGQINFIKMVEPVEGKNIEKKYLKVFKEIEDTLNIK